MAPKYKPIKKLPNNHVSKRAWSKESSLRFTKSNEEFIVHADITNYYPITLNSDDIAQLMELQMKQGSRVETTLNLWLAQELQEQLQLKKY